MSVFSRLPYSQREIRPLDKWEILPEQIEIEDELGRGAFGVVYKQPLERELEWRCLMPKLQRELYYPTKSHHKLLPSKVYMVRNIAH